MTVRPTKNAIIAIRTALISAVLLVTLYVDYLEFRAEQNREYTEVTRELSLVRAKVDNVLKNNISLTSGLASYISFNPNLTQAEFERFASTLIPPEAPIVSIGAAKDLTITHIYPLEGNEPALGFAYNTIPEQYATVLTALEKNRTVIAGPVELVQGGIGLIARLPVQTYEGKVWGLVSVVLDYQSVVAELESDRSANIEFGLKGKDGKGADGEVFYGNADLFKNPQISQTISLPYGSWIISAQPKAGWTAFKLHPLPWFLASLVILFTLYTTRLRLRHLTAQFKRTTELESSEAKFRAFFDQNSLYMMILDDEAKITQLNNAAIHFYGYEPDELENVPISALTNKLDSSYENKAISNTKSCKFITRHKLADGMVRDVEIYTSPIELNNQKRIFTTILDITEKVKDERDRRLFEQVYEHSQEGILVTDHDHKIIAANPAFERITGYRVQEVLGHKPSVLRSDRHDSRFYKEMHDDINMLGFWRGEIWNKNKSGALYPQLLSISQVKDKEDKITNLVAVFSDITQQKESEEKLEKLAHYDELTGLPNRLTLRLQLEHQIKVAKRKHSHCAVLFVDLDRFKIINDSLGHAAGDILLKMVGERIKSRLREEDVLGRLGGDEFVILIADYGDETDLEVIAHDVCEQLKKPFEVNHLEANVGASIGIAQYPKDAQSADALINFADASMYKAKKSETVDFTFYESSITEEASSKLTIKADIKRAIENDEFELLLQPQINLRTNTICGGEALIRWKHPEKGYLTPDRFITLAEETGDIKLITHWVLSKIFELQNTWRNEGKDLRLSVNISARELGEPALFEYLHHLVALHPNLARYLSLEIVESALVEKFEETSEKLQGLRELGFQIEIDDFGTGFSSLSYLGQLPVDALKIDKIFVQNMDSKVQGGIVKSIIALADNFDLSVVSEGIETQHHAELLLKLGCEVGQGYFYSKPIPIAEFEARYLHNQTTSNELLVNRTACA